MTKEDFPLFCTMYGYLKIENSSNDTDFYKSERFLLKNNHKSKSMKEIGDPRMLKTLKEFIKNELPLSSETSAISLKESGIIKNFEANHIDLRTFTKKYYPYLMASLKEIMQVRTRTLKMYTPQIVWTSMSTRYILKYTDPLLDMQHYHFLLDLYNSMSAAAYSYDLTDLFYWCYFCVKKRWWNRFPFLYVDEVQDLSDDMIDHLQRLSVNALGKVVFFGHNAQNIARGMSLKFFSLADKLLMSDDGFSSDFIQLTKNFRSQQEIIDLGNSIFKILLLVSKGDLEIMPNEESIKSGPKPLCLEVGLEVPDLIEFNEKYLGKEYVVLVRDKDAKLNLPD